MEDGDPRTGLYTHARSFKTGSSSEVLLLHGVLMFTVVVDGRRWNMLNLTTILLQRQQGRLLHVVVREVSSLLVGEAASALILRPLLHASIGQVPKHRPRDGHAATIVGTANTSAEGEVLSFECGCILYSLCPVHVG